MLLIDAILVAVSALPERVPENVLVEWSIIVVPSLACKLPIKLPVTFTSPCTCNFLLGLIVPIPTLPSFVILNLSDNSPSPPLTPLYLV